MRCATFAQMWGGGPRTRQGTSSCWRRPRAVTQSSHRPRRPEARPEASQSSRQPVAKRSGSRDCLWPLKPGSYPLVPQIRASGQRAEEGPRERGPWGGERWAGGLFGWGTRGRSRRLAHAPCGQDFIIWASGTVCGLPSGARVPWREARACSVPLGWRTCPPRPAGSEGPRVMGARPLLGRDGSLAGRLEAEGMGLVCQAAGPGRG